MVINGESSEGIGVGVGIAGGTECSHVITVELLGAKLQIGMGMGKGKQKWRGRENEECSRNDEEAGFHFITAVDGDSRQEMRTRGIQFSHLFICFSTPYCLFHFLVPKLTPTHNTPTLIYRLIYE